MEQSCFFFGAGGGCKEFPLKIYYALSKIRKMKNKFCLIVVEEKETFAVQFMLLNQFLLLLFKKTSF